jgi:hypothetical protein
MTAHNLVDRLSVAPGIDQVCIGQYKIYRSNLSPVNKERLRIAELVPRYGRQSA